MGDGSQQDGTTAPPTYFAAAGRAESQDLRALSERALSDPILGVVFEAVSGYALVIDAHRQIIAANDALLEMLGNERGGSLLGQRPGELLGCVNAKRGPDGCGTSVQCRHCRAVAAILAAQVANEPIDDYCTVACCHDAHTQTIELRVRVSPLDLGDARVYVFVFQDVTANRRRELLERIFLHDLGNLVTGLLGWSEELGRTPAADAAAQIIELSNRISEDIEEQRFLVHCESGEFKVTREIVPLKALVDTLHAWFGAHRCSRGRHFSVQLPAHAHPLATDRSLLLRVLGNLLKNAFEGTLHGGTVTLQVKSSKSKCVFEIHNSISMEPEVARRILKERFSTKGPARGLGLHAAQLFGEQCLGGRLSFESSSGDGTVFRFELPSV